MADVEIPSQIDLLHEEDLNRTTAVCAVIVRLSPNSPLVVNVSPEKVALREGDGILSVNGKTFATMHEFAALVQHTEKLVLEVVRLSEAPVLQQHLDRARDLQLERLSRITAQKVWFKLHDVALSLSTFIVPCVFSMQHFTGKQRDCCWRWSSWCQRSAPAIRTTGWWCPLTQKCENSCNYLVCQYRIRRSTTERNNRAPNHRTPDILRVLCLASLLVDPCHAVRKKHLLNILRVVLRQWRASVQSQTVFCITPRDAAMSKWRLL